RRPDERHEPAARRGLSQDRAGRPRRAQLTTMNAWALHAPTDDSSTLRWGTSAAVILALHAGLIALGIAWYAHTPPAGSPMATILVDLPPAPSSAAPEPSQMDVAPGPEMQQADAPSPPPPE